jgi:hypothetical protein
VLRPGGTWLFSVWDRIGENEFAQVVTEALSTLYPESPPDFMARVPHGYFDRPTIAADLACGGFDAPFEWETITARSTAPTAAIPAKAYCEGTPWRSEIEARAAAGGASLAEATRACERAIAERFGTGPVDGKIQAHVIAARK